MSENPYKSPEIEEKRRQGAGLLTLFFAPGHHTGWRLLLLLVIAVAGWLVFYK